MNVSILQLLPQRPRRLEYTLRALQPDTLIQLCHSIQGILGVPIRSQDLDPIRDGTVWFFTFEDCQHLFGVREIRAGFGHGEK